MRNRTTRLLPKVVSAGLALAALAVLCSISPAQDENEPEQGVTRSGAVPGDTTITTGEIPDEIVGRWVAIIETTPIVNENQTGAGKVAIARTFEITEVDDSLVLNLHRGPLPDALKERLDPRTVARKGKATPGPAASGPPDAATLADVARAWPGLLAPEVEPRAVASRVITYAMVPEEEKAKLGEPGTQFFILFDEGFKEGDTKPRQNITTLSVREIDAKQMKGKALQAVMLPGKHRGDFAFPPVALALGGEFVAYRVPDDDASAGAKASTSAGGETSKGFFEGLFSGCGG